MVDGTDFILDDRKKIVEADFETAANFMADMRSRRAGLDQVIGCTVSTVFIGIGTSGRYFYETWITDYINIDKMVKHWNVTCWWDAKKAHELLVSDLKDHFLSFGNWRKLKKYYGFNGQQNKHGRQFFKTYRD